jgi:hypothetical protein
MKKIKKTKVGLTDCNYLPQYLTSTIGRCARYCTNALPQPSKWPVFLVHFLFVVLFAVALVAAGAIWSK